MPSHNEQATRPEETRIGKMKRASGCDGKDNAWLSAKMNAAPKASERTGNKNGSQKPAMLRGGCREIIKDNAAIETMQSGKLTLTR